MEIDEQEIFQGFPWDGSKESLIRSAMTYVWSKYHLARYGTSPVDFCYQKNLGDGLKVVRMIHQLQGGDITELVSSYFEDSSLHLIAVALLQRENLDATADHISRYAKNFEQLVVDLVGELLGLVNGEPGRLNTEIVSRAKGISPEMVNVQYLEPEQDAAVLQTFRDEFTDLISKHFGLHFTLWGDNFWIEERVPSAGAGGDRAIICRNVSGFCDVLGIYIPSGLRKNISVFAPWVKGMPVKLRLYPENRQLMAASLAFKPQLSQSRPTLVDRRLAALRIALGLDRFGCAEKFENYLLEMSLEEQRAISRADKRMVSLFDRCSEKEVCLDLILSLMAGLLTEAYAIRALWDRDNGLVRQFIIALLLSRKEAKGELTPGDILKLRALVDSGPNYLFQLMDRMEKLFLKDGVQESLQSKCQDANLNKFLQEKLPVETEFDAWMMAQIDEARQEAGAILGARYGEI